MAIVLICGGRDYSDAAYLQEFLSNLHARRPFLMVIEGGAYGADRLARQWAIANNIHVATVNALWKNGKRAGHDRNAAMLRLKPDAVIAFSGGRGTADMVSKAQAAGVRVIRAGWAE